MNLFEAVLEAHAFSREGRRGGLRRGGLYERARLDQRALKLLLHLRLRSGDIVLDNVQPTPYNLHPTPCTLHPTPYDRNRTHYTLHPTPYTLNLTPDTLHHTLYTLYPSPAFEFRDKPLEFGVSLPRKEGTTSHISRIFT